MPTLERAFDLAPHPLVAVSEDAAIDELHRTEPGARGCSEGLKPAPTSV
jgi:hypothetical protein